MNAIQGGGAALLFFVLGVVGGSFASAASHRLPRGESVLTGRSRCPACGHVLGAADLVPLLSWLAAKGRCRHCGAPISWRYPALELVTGILCLLAWWRFSFDLPAAALVAATFVGLATITVADLETGIIPDAVLLVLLPLAIALRWRLGGDWVDAALGAATGFGALAAARWAYHRARGREGLGPGDVKFVGVAGIYLGLQGLAWLLIVGGSLGVAIGLVRHWLGRRGSFPLGPALCAAAAGLLLWQR